MPNFQNCGAVLQRSGLWGRHFCMSGQRAWTPQAFHIVKFACCCRARAIWSKCWTIIGTCFASQTRLLKSLRGILGPGCRLRQFWAEAFRLDDQGTHVDSLCKAVAELEPSENLVLFWRRLYAQNPHIGWQLSYWDEAVEVWHRVREAVFDWAFVTVV